MVNADNKPKETMMGWEIKEVEETRPITVQVICINGEQVGKIEKHPDMKHHPYHATINVTKACGHSLAQGFGETPQLAIEDAFVCGKKAGEAFLHNLEKLQQQMQQYQ